MGCGPACGAVATPPPKRYDLLAPLPPEGELDLHSLLPGEGPIEIDVGFGRGASLFGRAEAAPESRILGIEIKKKWATIVDERRARRGLDRVRVLAADARTLLARVGPEGSVQRVFLHFPDPWWKKRHRKRRVVDDDLLDTLARLIAPAGEVFVQTDVEERAHDYAELLAAHPAFELVGEDGFIDENPFGNPSNRELRAADDGLPVYRILAARRFVAALSISSALPISPEGSGDDADEAEEQQ